MAAQLIRLIDAVANDPTKQWADRTRETYATDANAILEALLAEYGVQAALDALVKQGFQSTQYRSITEALYAESVSRRTQRLASLAEVEA